MLDRIVVAMLAWSAGAAAATAITHPTAGWIVGAVILAAVAAACIP